MSAVGSVQGDLGDGLLANEAVSSAREQPLASVVADDGVGANVDVGGGTGGGSGAPSTEGVSDTSLYILTVNAVVGSGIVGLPFAFHEAGVVLSLCFLVAWTGVYIVTLGWLLLALQRAGGDVDWIGLVRAFLGWRGEIVASVTVLLFTYGLLWSYASMFSATATLLLTAATGWARPNDGSDSGDGTDGCDIYADPSDACVRANQIVALGFGALMLPLSLVSLAGQQRAQAGFTAYRFLAVALMLFSVVLVALAPEHAPVDATEGSRRKLGDALHRVARAASRARVLGGGGGIGGGVGGAGSGHGGGGGGGGGGRRWFDGLGIAFSTVSISQMCHLQAPALCRAAAVPERAHLVMSCALLTTGVLSAAVGCLALYFGDATEQLATLNWKAFNGAAFDSDAGGKEPPTWAVAVRTLVLLFPVIAAASAFPLSAIVLANNLREACELPLSAALTHARAVLGRAPARRGVEEVGAESEVEAEDGEGGGGAGIAAASQHDVLGCAGSVVLWRALAVGPPVLLTALFHKLALVFDISGLFSFVLGLALPSALLLRAAAGGRPLVGRARHPLVRALAHPALACALLLLAAVSVVLSLLSAVGVMSR